MIRLRCTMTFLLLFLMSSWIIRQTSATTTCSALQKEINGRCCDKCPPGSHMDDFCSKSHQTKCKPCEEGFYSDSHNLFDRCDPCQSCQQEYKEKCTNTTRGTCSCRSGYLCSNNICSECVQNKCSGGEKVKRTENSAQGLIEYSYQCEPKCSGNNYFDSKEDTCKPWTKCSALGLVEQIPGNTTHDSVCYPVETWKHRGDKDSIYLMLGIGFAFLSLSVFIFALYICSKNFRKCTANKKPVQAVYTKTSDFHLSKEESGLHVFICEEVKDSIGFTEQDLDKVSTLS